MSVKTPRNAVSASEQVVWKVADREGLEPTDIETPLNDVIDPDALDRLFSPGASRFDRPTPCVEFTYSGYRIRVSDDGVRVARRD